MTLQSVSDTDLTLFLKRAYRGYKILLCKKLNHFSSKYRRIVKFPILFFVFAQRTSFNSTAEPLLTSENLYILLNMRLDHNINTNKSIGSQL